MVDNGWLYYDYTVVHAMINNHKPECILLQKVATINTGNIMVISRWVDDG